MPGTFSRFKQNAAIGHGHDELDLIFGGWQPGIHVQFERATPFCLPLGIEKDDEIEPAVALGCRMIVEVHVWVEVLAVQVLVRAASHVIRVVQQIGNPGYLAHEGEEFTAAQHRVQACVGRSELRKILENRFTANIPQFVARVLPIERGEFSNQLDAELGYQEAVDNQVPKGPRGLKFTSEFGGTVADGGMERRELVKLIQMKVFWRKLVGVGIAAPVESA